VSVYYFVYCMWLDFCLLKVRVFDVGVVGFGWVVNYCFDLC